MHYLVLRKSRTRSRTPSKNLKISIVFGRCRCRLRRPSALLQVMHAPLASFRRENALAIVILYTRGFSENKIVTEISYQLLRSGEGLTPSIKKICSQFLVKKKMGKKAFREVYLFKNARNVVLIAVQSLESKVPYLFIPSVSMI